MNPTVQSVLVTFSLYFVICAFVEHGIHSFILHSSDREDDAPYSGHEMHHRNHDRGKYKSFIRGESFGLRFSMFFKVNAVMSLVAAIAAYSIGDQSVFWTGMLTAGCYFSALEAIHRRIHVPKAGGWFETTTFYAYLDRCHQVHHARGDRNFSIVAPFLADVLMRTFHPQMGAKVSADTRE